MLQKITDDMKQAMKDGDKTRLGTIRMLRAAIKDKEIELGRTLTDEDVIAVVGKLLKQRKDSANQYTEAGRPELAEKEQAEMTVLEVYLPEQLSDAEIETIIDAAIAETAAAGMKDMGKVMGTVRPKLQGKADMALVSSLIKNKLQA